jgi:hypothetical protein
MKIHPRLQFAALVLSAALLACSSTSQAAVITWGLPTLISGDSDVSTTGTLIGAFNIGHAVPNTTVNGVPFSALQFAGTSVTSGDFNFTTATTNFAAADFFGSTLPPFSNLSAPYQVLLSSGGGSLLDQFTHTDTVTLTISNLTVGAAYEFEWWSNASNSNTPPYTTIATAGNSISLIVNVSGAAGGLGQFAIGNFVADATSQTIVFNGALETVIDGIQLRQTAVPEPSTGAMLALGIPTIFFLCRSMMKRKVYSRS